eukprot:2867359-Rhodomonas_salina.2
METFAAAQVRKSIFDTKDSRWLSFFSTEIGGAIPLAKTSFRLLLSSSPTCLHTHRNVCVAAPSSPRQIPDRELMLALTVRSTDRTIPACTEREV